MLYECSSCYGGGTVEIPTAFYFVATQTMIDSWCLNQGRYQVQDPFGDSAIDTGVWLYTPPQRTSLDDMDDYIEDDEEDVSAEMHYDIDWEE